MRSTHFNFQITVTIKLVPPNLNIKLDQNHQSLLNRINNFRTSINQANLSR